MRAPVLASAAESLHLFCVLGHPVIKFIFAAKMNLYVRYSIRRRILCTACVASNETLECQPRPLSITALEEQARLRAALGECHGECARQRALLSMLLRERVHQKPAVQE